MRSKKIRIFLAIITLTFGGLIYICSRSEKLLMFHWFKWIKLYQIVYSLRSAGFTFPDADWFRFSLPDGLWLFSYIFLMLEIWNHSITKYNFAWIICIPLIALLSEIFQLFGILSGTFDILDIIFYLVAIALSFFISKFLTINTHHYENN